MLRVASGCCFRRNAENEENCASRLAACCPMASGCVCNVLSLAAMAAQLHAVLAAACAVASCACHEQIRAMAGTVSA